MMKNMAKTDQHIPDDARRQSVQAGPRDESAERGQKRSGFTSPDVDGDGQKSRSSKRHWTRTGVNFLLDSFLLTTFVTILAIATIVRFVFPPAENSHGWRLWGWSLEQWHELLFAAIAVLAGAVLLHIMLHWNWVCGVVSNKLSSWFGRAVRIDDASKTLWGVSLLITVFSILAIVLAIAGSMIKRH